jgi:hypothetical protein
MAVSVARGVKNPLGFGLIALVVMLMAGPLPTAFIGSSPMASVTTTANPIAPPTNVGGDGVFSKGYGLLPITNVRRHTAAATAYGAGCVSLVCAAVSFVKDGRPAVGLPGYQVQVPAVL